MTVHTALPDENGTSLNNFYIQGQIWRLKKNSTTGLDQHKTCSQIFFVSLTVTSGSFAAPSSIRILSISFERAKQGPTGFSLKIILQYY